jgi:hypothetical protein
MFSISSTVAASVTTAAWGWVKYWPVDVSLNMFGPSLSESDCHDTAGDARPTDNRVHERKKSEIHAMSEVAYSTCGGLLGQEVAFLGANGAGQAGHVCVDKCTGRASPSHACLHIQGSTGSLLVVFQKRGARCAGPIIQCE